MNRLGGSEGFVHAFDRLPKGVRFWTAVVSLATVVGFSVAIWPIPSFAVIAILGLMISVMTSRGFAIGAFLMTSMVTLGAISWLGFPSQAALLTKVLIGLFVLGVMLDWTPERHLEIPVVFIMLAAVLVISAIFGSGGRFLAAQAMGAYLAAPLAYLGVIHSNLSIATLRRLSFDLNQALENGVVDHTLQSINERLTYKKLTTFVIDMKTHFLLVMHFFFQ